MYRWHEDVSVLVAEKVEKVGIMFAAEAHEKGFLEQSSRVVHAFDGT